MRIIIARAVARPRRLALLVAGAALVVSACAGTASPSPAPASPVPSPAASAAASPSAAGDFHADRALEARLPDSIGGVAMAKMSMTGADFMAAGGSQGQSQLRTLLQELGRTDADLSVALTYDTTGTSAAQAALFQVKGADPTQLLDLWVAAQRAATNGRTLVTNVTIGGRIITRLEDTTSDPARVSYAWPSGDAIVIVSADSETIVSEVLAKVGS